MWDMRANAKSDPTVVGKRRLPRPVVWLLWLLGALLASVVLGFLAGLARPREPDPWAPTASPESPTPEPLAPAAASPDLSPLPAMDD